MAVAFEGNIVFDAAHKFQNHKKKLRSVVLSVNICDQKTFLKHDFDAGGNLWQKNAHKGDLDADGWDLYWGDSVK